MFSKKETLAEKYAKGRKIILENAVLADPAARENAMELISLFASLDRANKLEEDLLPNQKYFAGKGIVVGAKRGILASVGQIGCLPLRSKGTKQSTDFWKSVFQARIAVTKRLTVLTKILRKRSAVKGRPLKRGNCQRKRK